MRAPWLSLVVIATLAVAIAANATIFSSAQAHRSAASCRFRIRTRWCRYSARPTRGPATTVPFYVETLRALQSGQRSFASSAHSARRSFGSNTTAPPSIPASKASPPEYFDALGVRAERGPACSAAATIPDHQPRVITRRLAVTPVRRRPRAIGQRIVADGRPLEIIGVIGGRVHRRPHGWRRRIVRDAAVPPRARCSAAIRRAMARAQQLVGTAGARRDAGDRARGGAGTLARHPGMRSRSTLPAAQQAADRPTSASPWILSRAGSRACATATVDSLTMVMALALALARGGLPQLERVDAGAGADAAA